MIPNKSIAHILSVIDKKRKGWRTKEKKNSDLHNDIKLIMHNFHLLENGGSQPLRVSEVTLKWFKTPVRIKISADV